MLVSRKYPTQVVYSIDKKIKAEWTGQYSLKVAVSQTISSYFTVTLYQALTSLCAIENRVLVPLQIPYSMQVNPVLSSSAGFMVKQAYPITLVHPIENRLTMAQNCVYSVRVAMGLSGMAGFNVPLKSTILGVYDVSNRIAIPTAVVYGARVAKTLTGYSTYLNKCIFSITLTSLHGFTVRNSFTCNQAILNYTLIKKPLHVMYNISIQNRTGLTVLTVVKF